MPDVNPKDMALMLYKLSIENNAMLRQSIQHDVKIIELLQQVLSHVTSDVSSEFEASVAKIWEENSAKRMKIIDTMLLAQEGIAKANVQLWVANAPDDLSGFSNTYNTAMD